MYPVKSKQTGFTIVELLIVIVVIAILAAITVVAFNGVQNQASDSAVQSDINQLYKKLKLAESTGQFEFQNESESQVNSLLGKANSNSYDTNHGFPLILAPHFIPLDDGGSIRSFSIAGVSKSGKVYYATPETGGVAKALTDYEAARQNVNYSIQAYQEQLDDPEANLSPEDIEWTQSEIASLQARLARINQSEASGAYLWSLTERPCDEWQSDPVRVCLFNYDVPVQSDDSYAFGGYVYDPAQQSWRSVYGIYAR